MGISVWVTGWVRAGLTHLSRDRFFIGVSIGVSVISCLQHVPTCGSTDEWKRTAIAYVYFFVMKMQWTSCFHYFNLLSPVK